MKNLEKEDEFKPEGWNTKNVKIEFLNKYGSRNKPAPVADQFDEYQLNFAQIPDNLNTLAHFQPRKELKLKIEQKKEESDETKFTDFQNIYSKKFSELLFESQSLKFEEKMIQIKNLAKTTRLLIGFKNMDEYESAKDNLKNYGVDVVQPKFYQRQNYFHVLAKLVPTSMAGVHTLGLLLLSMYTYSIYRNTDSFS